MTASRIEQATPSTTSWGFLEDEELMIKLRGQAREKATAYGLDYDDLLQDTVLWLAVRPALHGDPPVVREGPLVDLLIDAHDQYLELGGPDLQRKYREEFERQAKAHPDEAQQVEAELIGILVENLAASLALREVLQS